MTKSKLTKTQGGSALVTLLVFVAVGIIVTSAATVVTIVNTQGTSALAVGEKTLKMAESGIEEAHIRLLRDPDYAGGLLTISGGTVTITVLGDSTKTVISEANFGEYYRKLSAQMTFVNNVLTLDSWLEVE
jgi:hypothetical protein